MITQEAADKFGHIDLSKASVARLTPKQWVESNRQWKRIDNIDHAKFQLSRPSSNKVFWNSVLDLLGAA
jgi:hypothetical protein